jgi:radical SAM superfamily enzyme YgiQ (UPF0313 family)
MLWGLHPTALPNRTISEENVDFICQGEGFYTLPKLIDALKNNTSNYAIEGLWYKQGKDIIANPMPSIIGDLDGSAHACMGPFAYEEISSA